MKRASKLLTILLSLTLATALLLTGCGSSNSGGNANADADGSGAEGDAPGELVYLCRTLGDFGFNDNGWQGCQEAAEKYGYTANVIELGDDTATFENAFLDACDSGKYSVVVTQAGTGLSDFVRQYAADYPDMHFIVFDMGVTESAELPENAYGIAYRACESCFLAGALAAQVTKTNKIGILSNDNPGGNDFAAGYLSGAKYINPDCQVYYYYGAKDAAAWQEQAASMYDLGCDIVLCGSGRFALGVFNEALNRGGTEAGYYCIGIDTDMYYTLSQSETTELASVAITSAMKNLGDTIVKAFDKWEEGSLNWGSMEVYGITEGGVGLAVNDNYNALVPEEVRAEIEQLTAGFVDGSVEAVSFYDFDSQDAFLEWLQPQLS